MAAILLGYGNLIDGAVLSGAGWQPGFPLANLQTTFQKKVARSTGTTAIFDIDTTYAAPAIRCLGLCGHNLTAGATIYLEGSAVSNFAVLLYDSGAMTPYAGNEFLYALQADVGARYWRITIYDPGNSAGYVELGRIFIGAGWQPAADHNILWGARRGLVTATEISTSVSGVTRSRRGPKFRTYSAKFEWLSDDETMGGLQPIIEAQDIDREWLLFEDPAATNYRSVRNMRCRMRQLSDIEWPYYNGHNIAVEFQQYEGFV